MNHGFVKIAAAIPEVQVAHPKFNLQSVENLIIQAEGRGIEIITLPELCLTGYSCGDLFNQQLLLDEAEMALIQLMNFTRSLDIISIVGLPVAFRGSLVNCAAVIQKGRILGLVPKTANTPLKVEQQLVKHIPKDDIPQAHHWLLLHGRYVCTSRAPHCQRCALETICAKQMDVPKKG